MEFHPHEIQILKALKKKSTPQEISAQTGLDADAVLRAGSWLKTKELVEVEEKTFEEVQLGDEGKEYMCDKQPYYNRLPERVYLDIIGPSTSSLTDSSSKGVSLDELKGRTGFSDKVHNIAVQWLNKKGLVDFSRGKVFIKKGVEYQKNQSDEKLLFRIKERGVVYSKDLSPEELNALKFLKTRKDLIKIRELKELTLSPTKKSLGLSGKLEGEETVSQLTPEMLSTGGWRKVKFRPYDVGIYVKPASSAKKHPLQKVIDEIRSIFYGMGFQEIKGGLVESAFWNFDALFQPQDHPARDMHDTFYLKNPKEIAIPDFEKFRKNVKETHENGWTTGSTGYNYRWSEDTARKTLLRTHTTAVTVRHLSKVSKKDLPVKVFSIGKVFRNESVDYKHLPEFYQVEGIVVDENVNVRNLLGILKEFYDKMGFKVRFRPGYFPYTEMSVEPEVFFKEKGEWIELGGAGIFRPEVVKPLLGFDCPVLAWGLGLDRVVALKLGLTDIRNLYISDLDWLMKARTT